MRLIIAIHEWKLLRDPTGKMCSCSTITTTSPTMPYVMHIGNVSPVSDPGSSSENFRQPLERGKEDKSPSRDVAHVATTFTA